MLTKNQCSACGTARRPSNLLYDPNTFKPYCRSYEFCNNDHPNAPAQILANGKYTPLIPLAEAEKLYKEKVYLSHPDPDSIDELKKLLTKPISLRLNSPEVAKYLMNVKAEQGFANLAETIRFLLEESLRNSPVEVEVTPQPAPQTTAEEIEDQEEDTEELIF